MSAAVSNTAYRHEKVMFGWHQTFSWSNLDQWVLSCSTKGILCQDHDCQVKKQEVHFIFEALSSYDKTDFSADFWEQKANRNIFTVTTTRAVRPQIGQK